MVTGLRSEVAFNLTNGGHDDDGVARWQELHNRETENKAVWIQAGHNVGGVTMMFEYQVNTINGANKLVVTRNVSGNNKSWIKALERYTRSERQQWIQQAFKEILYGAGNGALTTAANVQANIGTVNQLFTRHAFSCANAAKTIAEIRGDWRRSLDVVLVGIPYIARKIATGILKASTFRDAKLTDLGVDNSVHGGYQLAQQCEASGIPAPRKAFTSTMQRTIETGRKMMQGMALYSAANVGANHGWNAFNPLPATIMAGIKEHGAGAENNPRDTLQELTGSINADNNGDWQVNANTLDTTWIEGNGSTWAQHVNTDSFSYFQQRLGRNLRADGAVNANGVGNIANQSHVIFTHSRQMKAWFEAYNGGVKPNNNETWKFEYVRIPGLAEDMFMLVEPVPEPTAANPAEVRVGNYIGFRQRDQAQLDVAPALHVNAVGQARMTAEHCTRCGSKFLAFYADTGM